MTSIEPIPIEDNRADRRLSRIVAAILDRHDDAERGHPDDVHRPDGEHHQHHRPAAAEAIEPLAQAEPEDLRALRGPVGEEETERPLAQRDSGMLERGELVGAGTDEDRAGE